MKRLKIKRVEVFIESPCNEVVKSRFGEITYLQKLRLEREELKRLERSPQIKRLHSRFTCKLLATILLSKKKKQNLKKQRREWWK